MWFETILNWEDALPILQEAWSAFAIFTNSNFAHIAIFSDIFSKVSLIDLWIQGHNTLWFAIILDMLSNPNISTSFLVPLFFADYQNSLLLISNCAPELFIAFETHRLLSWVNYIASYEITTGYDLFEDSIRFSSIEIVDNLFFFLSFIWIVILATNFFNLIATRNADRFVVTRVFLYIVSLAMENRIQLEILCQVYIWLFFIIGISLIVFDDDISEMQEWFDNSIPLFFGFVLIYLCYRYSIHYFSFLEATDTSGRSILLVVKQAFRDFMGSLGLFLRFAILLFRLNVYDNLDDLYDSYYIFVGDFEDENYGADALFPLFYFFFADSDGLGDFSLLNENDPDFASDLFMLYWITFHKFFLFLFLFVEEFFRIGLAMYISILITFEVHAANSSYIELDFFKKNK